MPTSSGAPDEKPRRRRYTCGDYREEMRLLGLKRQLEDEGLGEEQRRPLEEEIDRIERSMGMD